jgi:hypothetical protein
VFAATHTLHENAWEERFAALREFGEITAAGTSAAPVSADASIMRKSVVPSVALEIFNRHTQRGSASRHELA